MAFLEEAERISTSTLSEGRDPQQLSAIAASLQDAGIPFLTESDADPVQMGKAVITGLLKVLFWKFGLFRKRKAELLGWRIQVLQSDRPRATEIIRHAAEGQVAASGSTDD